MSLLKSDSLCVDSSAWDTNPLTHLTHYNVLYRLSSEHVAYTIYENVGLVINRCAVSSNGYLFHRPMKLRTRYTQYHDRIA